MEVLAVVAVTSILSASIGPMVMRGVNLIIDGNQEQTTMQFLNRATPLLRNASAGTASKDWKKTGPNAFDLGGGQVSVDGNILRLDGPDGPRSLLVPKHLDGAFAIDREGPEPAIVFTLTDRRRCPQGRIVACGK